MLHWRSKLPLYASNNSLSAFSFVFWPKYRLWKSILASHLQTQLFGVETINKTFNYMYIPEVCHYLHSTRKRACSYLKLYFKTSRTFRLWMLLLFSLVRRTRFPCWHKIYRIAYMQFVFSDYLDLMILSRSMVCRSWMRSSRSLVVVTKQ